MGYRDRFRAALVSLIESDRPTEGQDVVDEVMESFQGLDVAVEANQELRKQIVDRTVESMAVQAAQSRTDPHDTRTLFRVLDFVIGLSEQKECDETLPLNCVSSVMELEPLQSTPIIFSFIESRQAKLTTGMTAGRGKGPVLLRLLNELLKRLPRSKPEHVIFGGRILFFLSRVFPLPQAEKSGVNLRGNFNTTKPFTYDLPEEQQEDKEQDEEGEMVPDGPFYEQFWSLQSYFINPALLFVPALPTNDPFNILNKALTRTLDVFRQATDKEKAVSSGPSTSKAHVEQAGDHYFFPKFLTSPTLLDLEVNDANFRFQILLQSLFLFQYLLSFTPANRTATLALPVTNMPAFPSHILAPAHEKTVLELREKTWNEIESMQGGPALVKTAQRLLDREQVWIKWKLGGCQRFDTEPIDAVERSNVARNKANALARKPKAYPNKLGNPNLSRLWDKARALTEEQAAEHRQGETFDDVVRQWTMATRQLDQKRKALANATDNDQKASIEWELPMLERRVQSLEWRALRIGSNEYLALYSSIGKGDLKGLVEAIERERVRREEAEAKANQDPEAAQQAEREAEQTDQVDQQGNVQDLSSDIPVVEEVDPATTVQPVADPLEQEAEQEPATVEVEAGEATAEDQLMGDGAGGDDTDGGSSSVIVQPYVLVPSPKRKREDLEDGEENESSPAAKRARTVDIEISDDEEEQVNE